MTSPRVEYWVMRRVCEAGRKMTPAAHVAMMTLVNTGKLAMLPSGDIVEPVEVFDTEHEAVTHAEVCRRRFPREDFRVIMNAEVVT